MLQIDTIGQMKEKMEQYFGQATATCGETGGIEEIPLFQARYRYLAEEILANNFENENQLIYNKGQRITAKEIGVLAGLGHAMVQVYIKPVVSIMTVGEELVSIFEEPGIGQIRDINAYMLMALVEETGAKVGGISLVRDIKAELKKGFKDALDRSDVVILCGDLTENKKELCELLDSFGEPGVITQGLEVKTSSDCLISVMKDDHCCCCSRSKLVVALPRDPSEAMSFYLTVLDYFVKKYYFKAEDEKQRNSSQLLKDIYKQMK